VALSAMFKELKFMVMEVIDYRELFYFLTLKEIKIKYKQSIIGVGWAIFMPLVSMVIFTFIFTRIARIETDVPYPIFAYCGLLPWQLFAQGLGTATKSLVSNMNLVTKVYLPREAFPFAAVMSKMLDFAIGFLFVFVLMWYYKISLSSTILLFPALLCIQIFFTLGLGFFLSMGHLYFRDVDYIMQVVIQLWMYVTAVVYPLKVSNPSLQVILNLNPMTPIIDAYRDVILRGQLPPFETYAPVAILSILIFFFGWYLFHKMEFQFAEYI
jgi:lipopolysaccharide transport system permease protein